MLTTDTLRRLGVGEDAHLAELGGKAMRLHQLIARGLPVPPAFCIPTSAYLAYLDEGGAGDEERVLRRRLPDDRARRRLADLAYAFDLPAALKDAITQAVTALAAWSGDTHLFAVRSSAVDEDGIEASFAGQYVSRLAITPAGVPAAVRDCWASVWSKAAVEYRSGRGGDGAPGLLAIVVQPLVNAEVSAVAFTHHPADGSDAVLVNAAWGLGEGLVSGGVTADSFVVARDPLRVTSTSVGEKSFKVVPRAAGGTQSVPSVSTQPCLGADDVVALARLALAVEEVLQVPADVEACFAGGAWHLLQGRPITTLRAQQGDEVTLVGRR